MAHTILIVDDDFELCRALSIRAMAAGFEVTAAQDPDDALEIVAQQALDLIVLDIEMPRYNGLELHERLLRTENGTHVPVIYLSGSGSNQNKSRARELGAIAFFEKPYEATEMIAKISEILCGDPVNSR